MPGTTSRQFQQLFWEEKYYNRFFDITDVHEDQILLLLGAHTHFANLLQPKTNTRQASVFNVFAPSVSPLFGNCPSYGFMEVTLQNNHYHIEELSFEFFEQDAEFLFPKTISPYTTFLN